jgi:predicted phage tail protein
MARTQDFGTMFKDMMSVFPMDTRAFENAYRSQSKLVEKMSAVAIEAAQKSTDLSARWMQDTLAKLSTMTRAKTDPADYAKAMTDFMQATAEAAAEHMAAFAEVAKKVQTDTMELMLAAGKDMSEDVAAAARKVTTEVTSVAKKAAATAA